jgi:hypothetical protein
MEARSAENHWAVHHDLAVVSHKVEFRTQFFLLNKALREVAEGRGSGRAAQARLLNSGHPIVLTPDNIRENALPRFQAWANGDVRIAAVGLLFNTVSTLFARDAMQEADVFADEEATGRFAACSAGLVGSVFNVAETGLKRKATTASPGASGQSKASKWAVRLGRWGRWLGAGAAWGFAYYDFKNMAKSYNKGNYGMFVLYLGSGALNTLLGFMSIFTRLLAAWGGLIFLIALGIALLIEALQDSEAQNWLSHCFYGSEDRWPNIRTSDKELQIVLAV